MKPSIAIILCLLVLGVDSQRWLEFIKEAGQGTRDMWRAYSDMKEANWKGADKYFHARGNYDAAQRGPGGAWAAKVISDAREGIQRFTGRGAADSRADQFANRWGRSGEESSGRRLLRPRDGSAPGGGSQPWGQRGSDHCGDSGALCSGNARRAQGTAAAFACPSRPNSGSLRLPARPPALGTGVSYLSGPSLPSASSGRQGCGREMLSGVGGSSSRSAGAARPGSRTQGCSLAAPVPLRFPGPAEAPGTSRVAEMLPLPPSPIAISASEKLNDFPQVFGAREPKAQRQKCLQGSSQFPVRVARRSCAPAPPQRCLFKRTRASLSEATAVLCTVGFQ
ncbi:Serum amyloid A-3 protein [Microtus ochrogaster]|uniref:Serum amyloid A-3 protein n=1 Tax=Microtus ochrogaster TaxID=79684 RepID=A0A8J6G5D2_MICOH|nr:Serum amyloid A-3 protein [Microtus ochrogaster]